MFVMYLCFWCIYVCYVYMFVMYLCLLNIYVCDVFMFFLVYYFSGAFLFTMEYLSPKRICFDVCIRLFFQVVFYDVCFSCLADQSVLCLFFVCLAKYSFVCFTCFASFLMRCLYLYYEYSCVFTLPVLLFAFIIGFV